MATSVGFQLEGGRIPAERIETSVQSSPGSTLPGSETQVMSVTAPLVAGRTYAVAFRGGFVVNGGDRWIVSLYEDSFTGSPLVEGNVSSSSGSSSPWQSDLYVEHTAASTGSKTFVVTVSLVGANDLNIAAPSYLYVDYIRG